MRFAGDCIMALAFNEIIRRQTSCNTFEISFSFIMIHKIKIYFAHRRKLFLLAGASGVLFGLSFPPFPFGVLATVCFVPLLFLLEQLEGYGRYFRYTYFTFFIGCLIALYWVGGFTHRKDEYLMMAGGMVLLFQPFMLTLPIMLYRFVRKRVGLNTGLITLPFLWIFYEWIYALSEFAFPWLTLGNTQTYHPYKIQFIDITGVYGISVWLMIINILFFSLLLFGKNARTRLAIATSIIVLYILPGFYTPENSFHLSENGSAKKVVVSIIQPNIDPWEKWEGMNRFDSRWRLAEKYLSMSQGINNTDLVIWPETALLFNVPVYPEFLQRLQSAADENQYGILSGFINVRYYTDHPPITSSIIKGTDVHYDSYNSILNIQPGSLPLEKYHKMRLVPFAERIPYAEKVPFLIEPLRWSVGISNWGLGIDSTIFHEKKNSTRFLAMVCYESIFPEFVCSFVRKGAEFLVFITNDSWWGNTSGARQHSQYAVLRAIENRRWVVRCANGGISCFIDPMGRMYDATSMFSETVITRQIEARREKTFYTIHGDYIGRISFLGTLAALCIALIMPIIKKKR
jgi:apolipoprotein N-acyltransferase